MGKAEVEVAGRRWNFLHTALLILSLSLQGPLFIENPSKPVVPGAIQQAQPFRSCPRMLSGGRGCEEFPLLSQKSRCGQACFQEALLILKAEQRCIHCHMR